MILLAFGVAILPHPAQFHLFDDGSCTLFALPPHHRSCLAWVTSGLSPHDDVVISETPIDGGTTTSHIFLLLVMVFSVSDYQPSYINE
jgi:hypothetical protein